MQLDSTLFEQWTTKNELNENADPRIIQLEAKMNTHWEKLSASSCGIKAILNHNFDKRAYAIYLIETYHYARHNPRHQALVGARLDNTNHAYIKYCFRHAMEETGHEMMAIADLKSLGVNIAPEELPSPLTGTEALIGYLYHISNHSPVAARLGYSFWSENSYKFLGPLLYNLNEKLRLAESNLSFFVAHSKLDEGHIQQVIKAILNVAKTEEDWLAIEKVMIDTLQLSINMLDNVFESYQALCENKAPEFAFLNTLV